MKKQLSAFLLSGGVMVVSLGILTLGYYLNSEDGPELEV